VKRAENLVDPLLKAALVVLKRKVEHIALLAIDPAKAG
jgi:hypothetical protein